MEPIKHRYDFLLLFDVINGNPNGDPDAGNSPRLDPETGHGLVTDVCLKRKIRNFICLTETQTENGNPKPKEGYDIYVKEKAILNEQHKLAHKALGIQDDNPTSEKQDEARRWMCQTFFDIRMFGAVMTTGVNCGQVRGPVQLAFAKSIEPIVALEESITRMAVTTEEEAKKQQGGNRTIGRKEIVPYGLYELHGFVSPFLAAQTGFSGRDLTLLWNALKSMFEQDRSSARGEMSSRRLVVFEHESALGNAAAHALFERVKITRKDLSRPARAYSGYDVTVDRTNMPQGITIHDML